MAGTRSGFGHRLIWGLLAVNGLVLAAGVAMEMTAADRARPPAEINAEKITLWREPASKPAAAPVAPSAPVVASAPAASPPSLCLELEGLDQRRYVALREVLTSAGLGPAECGYVFDKKLGWWVFWPPEYEAIQRDKAIKGFQAAGVKDVLPINQGPMAQAFSLGVFVGETQARQFRDQLRGKGLAKAEFGPRPSLLWARLRCAPEDATRLDRLKVALPAWAAPVDAGRCLAEAAAATPPPR